MISALRWSFLQSKVKPKSTNLSGFITYLSSVFYRESSSDCLGNSLSKYRLRYYVQLADHRIGFKFDYCLCTSRCLTNEAKVETPPLQFGHSKSIETIFGIVNQEAWSSETEIKLTHHFSDINVHVVVKIIKTVPIEVAIQFFHWLTSQGFPHEFRTYHALIDALGEARQFDKMRGYVDEMRKCGCTIRAMLYRDLIYWCACAGDYAGAMSYWEDAKRDLIKPSAALWTALIDVHAKAGNYVVAVELFSDMLDAGLMPNHRTISIFLDHLVQLGNLDVSDTILNIIQDIDMFPSMSTYACLMSAHAKSGNVVMLNRMGKWLRRICNRPGHPFWNSFKMMQEHGMDRAAFAFGKEVWPELSSQEIIQKIDSSLLCKSQEESPDNVEDCGSLSYIETGLSHIHLEKILQNWNLSTLSLLKRAKVKWNNDLIYELLSRRIQKPQIAWSLFCWLKSELMVQYDVFNQTTMLRILSRNNMFSSFKILITEMQRQRLTIPIITFNFTIKDFAQAKNAQAACWVFDKIKEFGLIPDHESFSALLEAYSRAKCYNDTLLLLEKMEKAGYLLDSSTCTMVIGMFRLAGKVELAHSIFHSFLVSGGKPDAECITALLKAYCHSGHTELALQTFSKMKHNGITPYYDTFWTMGWVHLQTGNLEKFNECMKLSQETLLKEQKKRLSSKEALITIKTILFKTFIEVKTTCLDKSYSLMS